MKYDSTNRTLTLEPIDCRNCQYGAGGPGQYTGRKTCDTCHGTGDGPRGGKRKCRGCYGSGTRPDFDNPVVCPSCNGAYENADMETFCDYAPAGVVTSMPIAIARMNRVNHWHENHLGTGLWSSQDYGDMAKRTDEEALEYLRAKLRDDHTQAVKIVRKYQRGDIVATLHDALVLVITADGYNVQALSDLPEQAVLHSLVPA